ncbi:solute carrier family 35 member F2-like [Impatiens glandulifera]|uniref:solute carrier family 35 member F2-like n=1 Tax=Impatiens glandulifera TaxID=253017 RepID=UPI001FB07716|nr:solute carrier family 35 member F2-like [Impatiens glandulifera]
MNRFNGDNLCSSSSSSIISSDFNLLHIKILNNVVTNTLRVVTWTDRLLHSRTNEFHRLLLCKSRCLGIEIGIGFDLICAVNKAYEYSPITSVTILSCCAIAWAIVLTWIFLGTKYSFWQLFGAVLCVLALGLVLFSDAADALLDNSGGGLLSFLGDGMVIAGTLFFAMSNVGEEFCVKNRDRVEVVFMVGLYGLIVTIVQIFFLERKSLESLQWSPEIVLCFAGYAISSFTLYSLIPYILKAVFNLLY